MIGGTYATKHFFVNMRNQIDIDEKWFYMTQMSQRYFLHLDETDPFGTQKNKRCIPNIMFLATVAR